MNKTLYSPLIFELSHKGRHGYSLPDYDYGSEPDIPANLKREKAPTLPEIDEPSVVRHYTNSSNNNINSITENF